LGLREDATTITVAAGAGVLSVLSWFYYSPIFGIMFGLLLGTVVAEYANSRAWKRTINRDFALKNIDMIYTPLFKEIGEIFLQATNFNASQGYTDFKNDQWVRISSEPYYRFIPEDLQDRLTSFYDLVSTFNDLISKVNVKLRNLIEKETAQFYGSSVSEIGYALSGGKDVAYGMTFLINPILFGVHPRDILEAPYPDKAILQYRINYTDATVNGPVGRSFEGKAELDRFDEFYKRVSKVGRELDVVKQQATTLPTVISTAVMVREMVFRKIKEPWTI
jgi:hypothetical protein